MGNNDNFHINAHLWLLFNDIKGSFYNVAGYLEAAIIQLSPYMTFIFYFMFSFENV